MRRGLLLLDGVGVWFPKDTVAVTVAVVVVTGCDGLK